MKKCIIVLLIVLTACSTLFAAYYNKGNGVFTVRAGAAIPAFVRFFHPDSNIKPLYTWPGYGAGRTNMSVGGFASLAYQTHLSSTFLIGGELGYQFNYSRSKYILTVIPLSCKLGWIPIQTGKFDLVLSLNIGGCYERYSSRRFFAPFASVAIQPAFFFNDNWGLGIETGLAVNTEFYSARNTKKYNDSCVAGFIPVSLVLNYRH